MAALESKLLRETILGLFNRGADVVRIGRAAEYNELTVEELQQMHQEEGLAFEYQSSTNLLVITRDQ